ncbi:MAG: sigma factor-like helix-turn-helix DNA-binding protein [Pseudonocardiaceae bacterium]
MGAAERVMRRTQTAQELADKFGVSKSTIKRLVAEDRGDYIARAVERRKKAVELRKKGLKYRQIAEQMNISTGSVGTLIRQARIHGEMD